MVLAKVRSADRELIVHFDGFENPEEAIRLRGKVVFVKAEGLPKLPEGEYYHHQLIGLTVVDEKEQTLGVLESILETGANDVYVIRTPEGKELLLPAIEEVVLVVDLDKHQMIVRPPEWY